MRKMCKKNGKSIDLVQLLVGDCAIKLLRLPNKVM